ncbi:MAG: 50S ribosomal protein L24 [Acidobacteria bacterium]|nr:50S ribosomal protein L24 [Acidobacteriota bacterium]
MAGVNIKKNDTVVVIAGSKVVERDSGGRLRAKRGRVIEVQPRSGKVLVEGFRMVKRHMKANQKRQVRSGIIEREAYIDVSNVMVVCPACDRPTRVAHETTAEGRRTRICKRCGGLIDKS